MVDLQAPQNSNTKATVVVDFGPSQYLRSRIKASLKVDERVSPEALPEVVVDLSALCPEPSPKQQATFGDHSFVVFGVGESLCKTYTITIAVDHTQRLEESLSDRTPPKLLAFVSYHPYSASDSSITKNESYIDFGLGARESMFVEWKCPVEIIEMDPEAFFDQIPGSGHCQPSAEPFYFVVDIQGEVWKEHRFPVATLPSLIVINIASYLPLPSVQSLAQAIPDFVPHLALEPWRRISALLRPYLPDLPPFVSLLKKTGSLVSGSTALYAFMGNDETWTPNDLDLVVAASSSMEVERFLLEKGWKRNLEAEKAKTRPYATDGTALKVFKKNNRSIDVVSPHLEMHVVDFICTYHSTPPMAFFTGSAIAHLFPRLTLACKAKRCDLRLAETVEGADAGRAKYANRGYTFIAGLAVPTDVDKKNILRSIKTPIYKANVQM